MNWFLELSIQNKLFVLLTGLTAAAIVVVTGIIVLQNFQVARNSLVRHVETLANVVGDNSVAAITFADTDAATMTLNSLKKEPAIENACLFDHHGTVFATYDSSQNRFVYPTSPPPQQTGLVNDHVVCCKPISDNDGLIGHIFIRSNIEGLRQTRLRQLRLGGLVLLIGLIVSTVVSWKIQNLISGPILSLAKTAHKIKNQQDFSIRVSQTSNDEMGFLTSAFNDMLSEIESYRIRLEQHKSELKERVKERTEELTQTNEQLRDEIASHEHSQKQLKETQKELVEAARSAGMADIATGILHNIGNVLNSVNVTANLMAEATPTQSRQIENLGRIVEVLRENQNQLGPFFFEDERGKHVQPYLEKLTQVFQAEHQNYRVQLENLIEHINHIKQTVSAQQAMAKLSGVTSNFRMSEIFEEALRLSPTIQQNEIQIQRNFKFDPEVISDKHRVLQIIVNLISNAKHALISHEIDNPVLGLSIQRSPSGNVQAVVYDNGIGIQSEHLDKIFSYGFTTKKDGHGFGLHTSALAATELGGHLEVHSNGLLQGARFLLTLPI